MRIKRSGIAGVGKCPAPGQSRIGKCPAVAGGGGGGLGAGRSCN